MSGDDCSQELWQRTLCPDQWCEVSGQQQSAQPSEQLVATHSSTSLLLLLSQTGLEMLNHG